MVMAVAGLRKRINTWESLVVEGRTAPVSGRHAHEAERIPVYILDTGCMANFCTAIQTCPPTRETPSLPPAADGMYSTQVI